MPEPKVYTITGGSYTGSRGTGSGMYGAVR